MASRRLSRMGPQPRDGAETSSDDDEGSPAEFPELTLSRFSRLGLQPRDVVEISSDDGGSPAPRTRRDKGRDDSDDDDCVVLDGDPDEPLAAAGAKERAAGDDDDASDEVEILATKGLQQQQQQQQRGKASSVLPEWRLFAAFYSLLLKKAGAERDAAAESCARKKARVESEARAAASKITVNLDSKLLECSACCSPLAPPLFQCTNGHITCSECRTNAEYSCSMCAEPANTRCDIMERVLGGMTTPCSFREFGCSATIPFTKKLTHEESCPHAPCHCPIPY